MKLRVIPTLVKYIMHLQSIAFLLYLCYWTKWVAQLQRIIIVAHVSQWTLGFCLDSISMTQSYQFQTGITSWISPDKLSQFPVCKIWISTAIIGTKGCFLFQCSDWNLPGQKQILFGLSSLFDRFRKCSPFSNPIFYQGPLYSIPQYPMCYCSMMNKSLN